MRFFDSGCTVSIRSSSSRQATEKSFFVTETTVPGSASLVVPVTRVSQIFNSFPSGKYVNAPGTGSNPRTRSCTSCAGRFQSIFAISFVSSVAKVASLSFCISGCSPSAIRGSVSVKSAAPFSISSSWSRAKFISASIGTTTRLYIAPVSIPFSIRMIVTPDSFSPLIIAYWIGAAPRYLGSKDACTLIQP